MKDSLANIAAKLVLPTAVIGGILGTIFITLSIASFLCQSTFTSGSMSGYLYRVSRFGDHLEIIMYIGENGDTRYTGCIKPEDEGKYRGLLGKNITVSWDSKLSISPFWAECASPVRLEMIND